MNALELEVALRGQRVARQELGELVDLARAERDVDEREAREHLVLDRLRPAAADADDTLGSFALEPLGLAEMGDEAAVRLLADRARVEQDQVGLARARRLGVAERLEHALHALGVVLVHLAAERGDVVALHRSKGIGLLAPAAVSRCYRCGRPGTGSRLGSRSRHRFRWGILGLLWSRTRTRDGSASGSGRPPRGGTGRSDGRSGARPTATVLIRRT